MITTNETSNIVNKNKKLLNLDNAGFVKMPVVSNKFLINL